MLLAIILCVLLLVTQFLIGVNILLRCKLELSPVQNVSLSVLIGLFVSSVIPLLLEILYIPIYPIYILVTFVLILVSIYWNRQEFLQDVLNSFKKIKLNISIYEYAFIIPVFSFLLIAMWRCYYLPPTARDFLVGAELLSKYTLAEGRIVSSVFTGGIEMSSNNPYKSPYLLDLQIIYKMMGFEFGKIWLIKTILCFYLFIYDSLRRLIHGIIAGFLILILTVIPDMFAYTFIALYDYSCTVYFFLAVYFFQRFVENRKQGELFVSSILFSASVFVRSETLVFILPALILFLIRFKGEYWKSKLLNAFVLMVVPFAFYAIWFILFNNFYLPETYELSSKLNPDLLNAKSFINNFKELNSELIFSKNAIRYYGYFPYLFITLTAIGLIMYRRTSWYIYWIIMVYVIYLLISHALNLVVIDQTVKRGFFKLFPLMIFALAENPLLLKVSEFLKKYEAKEVTR